MTKTNLIKALLKHTTLPQSTKDGIIHQQYYKSSNIQFRNLSTSDKLKRIEKDPRLIQFINDPTYEMIESAVMQDSNNIEFLDLHKMTRKGLMRLKLLII